MDQDDQSQLHPPQILGYLYQDYVPGAISPCTTHVDSSGEEVPSLFHLLSCGHIVAANDCDQRCGRNCQHAVATTSSPSLPGATGSKALKAINSSLPPLSTTQVIDELYCETCWGIPVGRYKRMNPKEPPNRIRHALAVTRSVLHSTLDYHEDQIDAMLCSLFFYVYLPGLDGSVTHKLRCGHLVSSVPIRPCASNCIDGAGSQASFHPGNVRQGDAILCRECVFRSDLVFKRHANVEEAMRSGRDSGYASAEPQLTSSHGGFEHGN